MDKYLEADVLYDPQSKEILASLPDFYKCGEIKHKCDGYILDEPTKEVLVFRLW